MACHLLGNTAKSFSIKSSYPKTNIYYPIKNSRQNYRLFFIDAVTRFNEATYTSELLAWIAVNAMVYTISSTKAPRDKSLTGLFKP